MTHYCNQVLCADGQIALRLLLGQKVKKFDVE